MNTKITISVVTIFLFIVIWLFTGIYRHREFQTLHLFMKHRPALQFYFYAPRGEAEPSSSEGFLTPNETIEEQLYITFIERNNGYKKSIYLPLP